MPMEPVRPRSDPDTADRDPVARVGPAVVRGAARTGAEVSGRDRVVPPPAGPLACAGPRPRCPMPTSERRPRPSHGTAGAARRSRGRAGVVGLVVAAAAMLLPACAGPTQPKEYGDAYRANFMIGCTGVEPNAEGQFVDPSLGTVPYCECVYQGLVDTVPFDQVESFEQQQAEAEAGQIVVPANIQAVYDRCKQSDPA